ncbi:MAG: hypothetical protein U0359_10850 [Byssovorax sp.]
MNSTTTDNAKRSGGLRDVAIRTFPIGVLAMRTKNLGEVERRRREMGELGLRELQSAKDVLPELLELCGYYEKVFPANAPYWKRAAEYAVAEAEGPAALFDQVERWGFVPDAGGRLEMPDWWNGKLVTPLEYMDYLPARHTDASLRAAGIEPERFHALAGKASDFMWMGYYLAKGALVAGGVSLLVKAVSDAVLELKQRVDRPKRGPLPIWVIGISEDEVKALRAPDTAVVGFNRQISPVMHRLVEAGQVRLLVPSHDGDGAEGRLLDARTREPVTLEGGQCYVCILDVSDAPLPVPDQSGVVMTNETLHHNPYDEQANMIRQMHRAALPVAGGGRAWVTGELFRVAQMRGVFIGLSAAFAMASWDAWVSFANGIVCVEELERRRGDWADEGVHLSFTPVPRGLAKAPSLIHDLLMCPTQTLISGY